jgi:4-hydroxyphenylacetate 3-monooxygenase
MGDKMLKLGSEYLAQLRDGRAVYVGSERIDDVTKHPAFKNAAHSIAELYDLKASAAHRDAMSFQENGHRYSAYFLQPKSKTDLSQRNEAHYRIADYSYGLLGRSPDHVASFVTGMSLRPEVFGRYADNIIGYYRHMRDNDIFAAYAVLPPQAARNPEFFQRRSLPVPTLRVVRETDRGLVISGMKMLATGAILANEILIGNVHPLASDRLAESVTCAVPANAVGLALWSRKPFEPNVASEADGPLTYRFDETDAMVVCDNVEVPWDRVFVHNDVGLARAMWFETPAHCFGNHQSNVRFHAKLRLLVGLANKLAQASGSDRVPSVMETLGRLASLEALLAGVIAGQISMAEAWPAGFMTFNRRMMYAALNWCTENHSPIIDCLRELCGSGIFQMPANASVLGDPNLREVFEAYWVTPQLTAGNRMKLFRLAWDLIGSEFAGRHQQYEKFYAGPPIAVRNYSYTVAPWDEFNAIVDKLLAADEKAAE